VMPTAVTGTDGGAKRLLSPIAPIFFAAFEPCRREAHGVSALLAVKHDRLASAEQHPGRLRGLL